MLLDHFRYCIPLNWIAAPVHVFLVQLLLSGSIAAQQNEGVDFFEARIRPLLVEKCVECHGAKKQEGGLRLDARAGWQAGGDQGAVIVPGNVADSRLMSAVRYADESLKMPPNKKLSDREIEDLAKWISDGAVDPREAMHSITKADESTLWSLQPIQSPQPPQVPENTWSEQPIDRFVLDRLRSAELQPGPPADRRTLIRRVTFALTGLPPTAEEVDAFVADTSDKAYEKVVDRLLSSPHYGEHWARHWLDVARYSDTKGYVYAREEKRWVHASAYRDWVAQAFNDDMPYDRFVRLQIAADQIEPARSPHLVAMGYLTLGRRFLGVTHDIIDDRIDVVTRGMLGMTVACARCHDHKYDPISTRDYYSLYGVFQSCSEELVPCDANSAEAASNTNIDPAAMEELTKRQTKLREMMNLRREEQAARSRSRLDRYLLAQLELDQYPEEVFNQLLDESDLNPVVVRRWQDFLSRDAQLSQPVFAAWHERATAKDVEGMRQLAAEYGMKAAEVEAAWRELLKSNPASTELPNPADEGLRRVLYGVDSPCHVPDEHITNIEMYFPTNVIVELWKYQGEVDRWLIENPKTPAHATVLVDRPKAVTPRVFLRGNPLNKGAEVPRHFLTALRSMNSGELQLFQHGSGRRELAEAITDPRNPLTARVIVNRVWTHLFGRGIVNTPSDFGSRAEPPTHPELLDWLASGLIDSGWKLKDLQRTILLSKTYQQDSRGPQDANFVARARQVDPDNRLLWRGGTHRLSFEEVRDAWLAASNELNLAVGGRPQALFAKENTRRTLYAYIDREDLSPVLRVFDFANPDLSIAERSLTTVPQQALFAMNHSFVAQRAKRVAEAVRGEDVSSGIQRLYRKLFQRLPSDVELELATKYLSADADPVTAEESSSLARAAAWSYGYGEFDVGAGQIKSFTSLPFFSGAAWQGGPLFPDAALGWVQLSATGGHPGNDLTRAIVRRWTAPKNGTYKIISQLTHDPEVGDGVRGFISSSKHGLLKSAMVHHRSEIMNVDAIELQAGDRLDFVVDIREGLNSDQFLWAPQIEWLGPLAGVGERVESAETGTGTPPPTDQALGNQALGISAWNAAEDFRGPQSQMLDRWEQLVQVLMWSNEFMFVD